VAELKTRFDIHTFDLMDLNRTISKVAKIRVSIVLIRIEMINMFTPAARHLEVRPPHLLGALDQPAPGAEVLSSKLGLCGVIDLAAAPSIVLEKLLTVEGACSQHPVDSTFSVMRDTISRAVTGNQLDTVDMSILALLAIGLRDEEISQSLHFSNQTIRNRVSKLLHVLSLRNRTELALAWHQFVYLSEMKTISEHA
jgi:DNA-binding CsgD family transcriptional regulator